MNLNMYKLTNLGWFRPVILLLDSHMDDSIIESQVGRVDESFFGNFGLITN